MTKGRFTITKQPSAGGPVLTQERAESVSADRERDELKAVIIQMQKKMEAMKCEIDQMKDQIADPIKAKRSALLLAMSSKNQKESLCKISMVKTIMLN